MKFLCEQCKAKYQIADDKVAGKTVRMKCRKCGHLIEVRAAVTETSVPSAPSPSDRSSGLPLSGPARAPRPLPPRATPLGTSIATSFASSKGAPKPERGPLTTGALEGAFKAAVQREEEGSAPFDMADLSPSDEWYVAINGVPVGPIRVAEVRRKAALGAVSEDSLVWQEGLDEWRPLRSFPELAASVRDAMSSARASRPPQPEHRSSSLPPPPTSRGPSSRAPSSLNAASSWLVPPRTATSPLPSIQSRSNVVPIMSRLATAEKLDDLAGGASPLPGAFFQAAAPTPSIVPDPFAAGLPASAVAARASLPPTTRTRPVPWLVLTMIAFALAFGVTAALVVFLRPPGPPTPAPPVAQAPTPLPAPSAAPVAGPGPMPEPVEAPAPVAPAPRARASGSKSPAVAEATPTSTGRSLDLHAVTQTAQTVTPTDESGGDAPKAPGQCFSQGQVQQVIGLHQTGIRRACWERNPTTKPTVNVDVLLTIGSDGSAQGVTATGDEPSVSKCIENDVRTWRFPVMGCTQRTNFAFKFVRQ